MRLTESAFELAVAVARDAAEEGVPLRLLGGQAVRLLCPAFPPRTRQGQDIDFASVSSARALVAQFMADRGFVGDRRFNTLHGNRQMYFSTPSGETSVDVVMDRLRMCHELEFKHRLNRMPHTLDVTDLLLTKLQVVEQNAKDAQDCLYLLAAYEVRPGDVTNTIGLGRFGEVVGADWGWWRTATRNLERIGQLAERELRDFVLPESLYDPFQQAARLLEHANDTPKSLKWRIRSKVGERVQWYKLPEEVNR